MQISQALTKVLPHYPQAIELFLKSLAKMDDKESGISGFMVWPLTDYVASNGLDHFNLSLEALSEMTRRFTAEFAIRHFLQKDPTRVFDYLTKQQDHSCHHIRRWISEGTRPKLPWGKSVPSINQNLARNLELILPLINDPELYVRKSVANHLNDISKLDPNLFFITCAQLKKNSTEKNRDHTQWIIKHAARSLIKAGHPKAYQLIGLKVNDKIILEKLTSSQKVVLTNDKWHFSGRIFNQDKKKQNILVNIIVNRPLKKSKTGELKFRLLKKTLAPLEKFDFEKSFNFRTVTTRTYHPGKYQIQLMINGSIQTKKLVIQLR
jgi:3-methyladenine DNA glycosylase AlkC